MKALTLSKICSFFNDCISYFHVITVLAQREIKSKFSGNELGYLWAFISPIAWIGLLAIFFHVIGRETPIYTDLISFLMAGMLPYVMFRMTITSVMRSHKAGRFMILFGAVSRSDLVFSTGLLEYGNGLVIYLFFITLNYLAFGYFEMHYLTLAIFGYSLAWALGMSFGKLAGTLAYKSDSLGRLVPVVLRPMFLLSGVFYTANELPQFLTEILYFNPLFHAIEIMRNGIFLGYESRVADIKVPILYIVLFYILACIAQLFNEKKVVFRD